MPVFYDKMKKRGLHRATKKPLHRQGRVSGMRGWKGYPRTLRHKSLILELLLDIDKITRFFNTFISVGY